MEDTVQKPVRFEEFLKNKNYQILLRLQHFRYDRDENGRLINTSKMIFYCLLPLHSLYFCVNSFDIARSLYLGVPSSQNLPVLTIATFFSIRGLMLFVKRFDIMDFLVVLDEEFPTTIDGQRLIQLPQALAKHSLRSRYMDLILTVAIGGYVCTPLVVYLLTYEGSDAFITEYQQLLGGYMPWGIRQSHLLYPLVYLFDLMCSLSGTALYASVDTFYYTMQGQLIMHLNYLKRQICAIDMSEDCRMDERELNSHICQLIRRQQKLNSMFDQFNDIFKVLLMVTDFIAATTICFHLYLITETSDLLLRVRYALPSTLLVFYTFETSLRGTQLAEAVSVESLLIMS